MAENMGRRPMLVSHSADEVKRELFENLDFALEWQAHEMAVALAKLVRDVRGRAGMTQAAVAEKLGVSQALIGRLEAKDPDRIPTMDTIAQVLGVCGYTVKILVSRKRHSGPSDVDQAVELIQD